MANFFKKSGSAPAEEAANGENGENPGGTAKKAQKAGFTLKPSKQTCAILGGLSGVVLAASVGLFIWQSSEIAQIDNKVHQKIEEVNNGNKIANHLAEVEADYNNMQGQLRYLETSISPKEYVPTLLKQMERLAKQTELSVQTTRPTLELAPEPPADKEARKKFKPWPYDKLHVDMDVSGQYWNVARLLYRLTTFEKIIAVENVQIVPVQEEGKYAQRLNVKLRLTGFIFKDEAAEGKPADGDKPADGAAAKPETKAAQAVGTPSGKADA